MRRPVRRFIFSAVIRPVLLLKLLQSMNPARTNGSGTSSEEVRMKNDLSDERFFEQKVTYTLEIEGRFLIVENVPARISERTGERFFSPETVESLQRIAWGAQTPTRVIQTPVFEYPKVG